MLQPFATATSHHDHATQPPSAGRRSERSILLGRGARSRALSAAADFAYFHLMQRARRRRQHQRCHEHATHGRILDIRSIAREKAAMMMRRAGQARAA